VDIPTGRLDLREKKESTYKRSTVNKESQLFCVQNKFGNKNVFYCSVLRETPVTLKTGIKKGIPVLNYDLNEMRKQTIPALHQQSV
jgi:hypothetical protein